MTILESESTGEGTPQGVVLALVGPESCSPKEQEGVRSLRMYNLASLVSLAKYSVVQKVFLTPVFLGLLSACSNSSSYSREPVLSIYATRLQANPLNLRHEDTVRVQVWLKVLRTS